MHQPNYLPWIGLFSKICKAEIFVVMDIAQLGNTSVTHRNKIRTNEGSMYLTIPISKRYVGNRISEVELPSDKKWQQTHWTALYHSYAKTKYFSLYREFFEELYQKDFRYLTDINIAVISYLLKCFDINVGIIKASEFNIDPHLQKTDLLIATLKSVGGDVYISGPSGKGYLEPQKFEQNDIDLKYFEFHHPVYQQRFPGFIPEMSAVDILFNMGPQSGEIIRSSGVIEGTTPVERT